MNLDEHAHRNGGGGMNANVVQIRPRAAETFVCPCGSQWFSRAHRFDTDGHCIESAPQMVCDGCDRKHRIRNGAKS